MIFCGTHMRSKTPRYWMTENPAIARGILRAQARWRGYWVRYKLKLAGPGVLKRSVCHNDDEMMTCDSKTEISPSDYFSVEENGKVWWFDQRTMIEWSQKSLEIRNPFTRTLLSPEDASRLRNLYIIRKKGGVPVIHTSEVTTQSPIDIRDLRWMRVVQVLNECGFSDMIHHENFIGMSYSQTRIFLVSLVESMRWWMYEKMGDLDPYSAGSKRAKYYTWFRAIRNTMPAYADMIQISRDVAGTLLAALNDIKNPTELSFYILGAYQQTQLFGF